MRLNRSMIFGLVVLLCSCSERNVHDGTGSYEPAPPVYATKGALKGFYRWGFETSAIHLCTTRREECPSSIGPDNGCWVEFTEAAYRQLVELRGDGDDGDIYGEVWMEGSGRVARNPGNFGHMGDYACQVELAAVYAIDPETPRALQPQPSRNR